MEKALKTHWRFLLLIIAGTFICAMAEVGDSFFIRNIFLRQNSAQVQMALRLSERLSDLGYPIKDEADFRELLSFIDEASVKYGIEKEMLLSIALIESGLNPQSISHKGAQGIFQILPGTAEAIWNEFALSLEEGDPLISSKGVSSLENPRLSTLLGAFYLSKLKIQFRNQIHLALAAYNVGPGALRRAQSQGELKGTEYIFRVYQLRNALKGA